MIVCCGEALIDFLPRKGADGADVFQPFVGGSVFNVAVAIGRLGAPAGYYGGLSTDFFGAMLREALEKSAVDLSLVNISDRPSTLAFVTLVGGDARYAFFDEHSAGRMLTEDDLPALPATVTALHFGSFSLAEEPCGSGYEALMQRESRARVISLDPNIRPTLIKNRDGYEARLTRLLAMADIVKLSEDDLAWIEADATFEDYAERALGRGAKLVILTRGAEGATAISPHAAVSAPAVKVTVADTVGAGDSFSAAILARLESRKLLTKRAIAELSEADIADLLAFATKAASITASRPGADSPWATEMAG
jgi:fructokinase